MLAAASLLLLLGLSASIVLAIASRAFYVWEDPKVLAITDSLPGANCGGCGQAGCAAAAEAIAANSIPVNVCVVGGMETAMAVGEIMGQKVEAREPEFHWTSCTYGVGEADPVYTYNGATDCQAAVLLYGGSKVCPIGCIGLGSCVKSCQFGALKMGDHNLPVVDFDLCVGCGACVDACPKGIVALTSATRRIVGEYTSDECTAPCQRACPTGIDIPGYIHEIQNGDYEEALRIIKEKCPLPLVCGYICPAPCELNCRRNLADEGVAIDPLKRFVADYEQATGKHVKPYKASDNGRRIALVGGGAEGLTAAYYLARLGYQPTIFESKPELGGILRYVIAGDRLPMDVLDHDIEGILDMGVASKTGMEMGRDFSVPDLLKDGYDAVMLTAGGFDSRKVLQPDQHGFASPVSGFMTMLDFLGALARNAPPDVGRRVVVLHAGPKALEVARKCRSMGAEAVTIVTHEHLEDLPPELVDVKKLTSQGIDVRTETAVAAVGGVSGRIGRLALERKALTDEGLPEVDILDADTLIASAARFPELVFVKAEAEAEDADPEGEVKWQTVETFRTFQGSAETGIFAPPEPGRVSDASAVVKAILSGRRLARAVHQHFSDGLITPVADLACVAEHIPDVTHIHDVPPAERARPEVLDVEGDAKRSWVSPDILPGLDEAAVRREADRCLQCGLICYRKTGKKEPELNHA
ncbi:MAG: FAD-dependent oxidoreductase [Deltaproteobacteria bacterium]|nr:FAD-dependent oxidoreductase [Deltaproteobacteria bacterium]